MYSRRYISLSILVCLLVLAAAASGQAPAVHKIEPPNWWVNFTPEVTLLLTGENLSAAEVRSQTQNLNVVGSKASANGHYLFTHLELNSSLSPVTARLQVRNASGSTEVQLPLQARTSAQGRYEGFSRDDVIYLIMPDRFADGDPSNDPCGRGDGSARIAITHPSRQPARQMKTAPNL